MQCKDAPTQLLTAAAGLLLSQLHVNAAVAWHMGVGVPHNQHNTTSSSHRAAAQARDSKQLNMQLINGCINSMQHHSKCAVHCRIYPLHEWQMGIKPPHVCKDHKTPPHN
jgi:hypothetical protein